MSLHEHMTAALAGSSPVRDPLITEGNFVHDYLFHVTRTVAQGLGYPDNTSNTLFYGHLHRFKEDGGYSTNVDRFLDLTQFAGAGDTEASAYWTRLIQAGIPAGRMDRREWMRLRLAKKLGVDLGLTSSSTGGPNIHRILLNIAA